MRKRRLLLLLVYFLLGGIFHGHIAKAVSVMTVENLFLCPGKDTNIYFPSDKAISDKVGSLLRMYGK